MIKRLSLLLLLTSVLFVMACTSDSEESDESSAVGTDETKTGDIVVGFDQDISTIDPHGANDVAGIQVRRQMYQTLIARDAIWNLNLDWLLSGNRSRIIPGILN